MNTGAFFTNGKARRNGQRQSNGLDQKGPGSQETLHDEASNNTFDLRDTGACGIWRKSLHEYRCNESK